MGRFWAYLTPDLVNLKAQRLSRNLSYWKVETSRVCCQIKVDYRVFDMNIWKDRVAIK